MIRLGLRLAVAGGREALARLALIVTAVAIGVGLLLAILAGLNAVNTQSSRTAWLSTSSGSRPATHARAAAPDPLWWLLRVDYFHGTTIGRLDVAATGPNSPIPPGIAHLPGPGQFYASPKLSELLASAPPGELADRFPGHQIGVIGPAALSSPDSALVIVGRTPAQLAPVPGAQRITGFATTASGVQAKALDLILSVAAAALLFPVLILVGTATRLAAARREQRFASMRLIGATPRQVSVLSAVESTVAAVIGTALGLALILPLHQRLAAISVTGTRFYPSDLTLGRSDVALVALGVPAAAALAARIALGRVRITPLGVTRRLPPRPPRTYRALPLLAGLGELAYFVGRRPGSAHGQTLAFLPGFLLVMAGLVIAGPWLTALGARLVVRRSRGPAALIAGRRLADNPQAGFRAVSGLVLALFVTSATVGIIGTIAAHHDGIAEGAETGTRLSVQFWPERDHPATATSVPAAVTSDLHSIPGVSSVTLVRRSPALSTAPLPGLASCADLARSADLGHCPPGIATVMTWADLLGPDRGHGGTWHGPATVWPAAPQAAADLARLPVEAIVVGTNGSPSTIEKARTVLEVAYPAGRIPPSTDDDFSADTTKSYAGFEQLAQAVVLISLPIAGCGLAVGVAGGLSERKRPFSLMRLSGVPLRVLRRVVALESAVPLLLVALVAIAAGFLSAQLFLRAQLRYTLRPPGAEYYLVVAAGLATSLAIIACTLPLLERITGPETARNE